MSEMMPKKKRPETLIHMSDRRLEKIEPNENMTVTKEKVNAIFALDPSDKDQRDFYALRARGDNLINYFASYTYGENKGSIFIFQEMKDKYYEHEITSDGFRRVKEAEWILESSVKDSLRPKQPVKEGTKEDVLKRTSARVYTITKEKLEIFQQAITELKQKQVGSADVEKEKIKKLIPLLDKPETSLNAVDDLVALGVLKWENQDHFKHNGQVLTSSNSLHRGGENDRTKS